MLQCGQHDERRTQKLTDTNSQTLCLFFINRLIWSDIKKKNSLFVLIPYG